ncbi:MAG: DUF374 domain-containing protein [Alphaproteobacteria bacterium]|nr:DUF374 domain-containing protein [Alphaproteobacteria bacterium]
MKKFLDKGLAIIKDRLKDDDKFEAVVASLLAFGMKFAYRTTRWKVVGIETPDVYHRSNTPFLVSLWHDRLMTAPCVWKWKSPLHVLASGHRDGRLIAKVVEHFNMPAVFGSTGKGVAAAKELIKLVKKGRYIAIIPDGPRGPRHKLAPGVITISKLTKTDILPFSCCVKRFYRFDSWDRFVLAWPFNKGVMVWGDPIRWTDLQNKSEEEARLYVESKINECSETAYRLLID